MLHIANSIYSDAPLNYINVGSYLLLVTFSVVIYTVTALFNQEI